MALNLAAPPQDPVYQTAAKRQFPRSLVGDFTFDLEREQHRHRILLSRNMTRVLAFHEKNRIKQSDLGVRTSARKRGPYLGSRPVKGQSSFTETPVEINSQKLNNSTGDVELSSPGLTNPNDTPAPEIDCISRDCLKIRTQMDGFDAPQRRSLRKRLFKQHEDKDAQLILDVCSIRKKLNFKESANTEARPRKRTKRDSVLCHCHITIWDNRSSLERREPIVRKSEMCEVTTTSSEDENSFFTDIKLDRPFLFKSRELQVSVQSSNGRVLGLGDNYFLEIKIIPAKENVLWPPIPVLGTSEGDQTTGLGQLAAERLQGALVMRYLHLPHPPETDVPLSVFFLKDGRTHRSKYGLEVRSSWLSGHADNSVKEESGDANAALWIVDGENRSLGRTVLDKPDPSLTKTQTAPHPGMKIVYNFDSIGAREAKEFRKASVRGLQCPACPSHAFDALKQLQFHFMTLHSKYKFTVEKDKEVYDALTNSLVAVTIKVTAASSTKPRNIENNDEDEWTWTAPGEPFDLPAYIEGDQKWLNEPPKKKLTANTQQHAVTDHLSVIRQGKNGFLPAEHVSPFRTASRRKHPAVRLNTMTQEKSIPYTSVSHRQRQLSEDAESETDDEVDNGPFAQKSLEELDVAAEKYEWSEEDRIIRSKWNRARFAEQLSHPRYLSDCLIRFVRAEKTWLCGGGTRVKLALADLLEDLVTRRVINEDVTRDVWCILHDTRASNGFANGGVDDHDVAMQDAALADHNDGNTSRREIAESMMSLPDLSCGICAQSISDVDVRGVHCAEQACEAPGVWYHTNCVRCKVKDKYAWKCALCIERLEEEEEVVR